MPEAAPKRAVRGKCLGRRAPVHVAIYSCWQSGSRQAGPWVVSHAASCLRPLGPLRPLEHVRFAYLPASGAPDAS